MKLEHWFLVVPKGGNRLLNVRDPTTSPTYCIGHLHGDHLVPDGTSIRTAQIEMFTTTGIYTDDDILYELGDPCPEWAADHPGSMRVLKAYQEELRNKGN